MKFLNCIYLVILCVAVCAAQAPNSVVPAARPSAVAAPGTVTGGYFNGMVPIPYGQGFYGSGLIPYGGYNLDSVYPYNYGVAPVAPLPAPVMTSVAAPFVAPLTRRIAPIAAPITAPLTYPFTYFK